MKTDSKIGVGLTSTVGISGEFKWELQIRSTIPRSPDTHCNPSGEAIVSLLISQTTLKVCNERWKIQIMTVLPRVVSAKKKGYSSIEPKR
jgi:hypothetical protein